MDNTVSASLLKKNVSDLIRSGILFPNRKEGELFIGMTLKSWLNLKKEEKIFEIYDRLNDRVRELFPVSVNKAINSLITSGKAYLSPVLWEGRRKQSKQRFALKLFFKFIFQNYPHIYRTLPAFITINEEEKELAESLEKGLDYSRMALLWFILTGYDIINPFVEISRLPKDSTGFVNLQNYIRLLEDIIKFWPIVGALSSFHEIEIYKKQIESSIENDEYVSPLILIGQLQNLYDLVEVRSSPENLIISNESADILLPEGIWIDNIDKGKSRFWIFPVNLRMIFCYSFEYGSWQLKVYEAISDYDDENEEYVVSVISPEESKKAILNGKLSSESIHEMRIWYSEDIEENCLEKLMFEHLNDIPEWFDFSHMMRLKEGSELHARFLEIIGEFYNPKPFGMALPLVNHSAWMTDTSNSLIAMDEKFLYLKDKGICRHIMTKVKNLDGEYYNYIPFPNKKLAFSLLDIKISENDPLYLIPKNDNDYPEIDSKDELKKMMETRLELSADANMEESDDYSFILRREAETYRRYKEAVVSTTFPGEITIYTIKDGEEEYKKICFNKCGVAVDLNKAIGLYGMKKITSLKD